MESLSLNTCLYLNSSKLYRELNAIAELGFEPFGLSPSHAFLMLHVNVKDGQHPSTLGSKLGLAPSTITRLVEKLERMGWVERSSQGKHTQIFATEAGAQVDFKLRKAWRGIQESYSQVIKNSDTLSADLSKAAAKLQAQ